MTMAAKLPPMQIGKYSQLQEWLEDGMIKKMNIDMFLTYTDFIQEIRFRPTPPLSFFEAARNSLNYRGDMATGWSIGWKVNFGHVCSMVIRIQDNQKYAYIGGSR